VKIQLKRSPEIPNLKFRSQKIPIREFVRYFENKKNAVDITHMQINNYNVYMYRGFWLAYPYDWRGFVGAKKRTSVGLSVYYYFFAGN
jgi:hypothetical protein